MALFAPCGEEGHARPRVHRRSTAPFRACLRCSYPYAPDLPDTVTSRSAIDVFVAPTDGARPKGNCATPVHPRTTEVNWHPATTPEYADNEGAPRTNDAPMPRGCSVVLLYGDGRCTLWAAGECPIQPIFDAGDNVGRRPLWAASRGPTNQVPSKPNALVCDAIRGMV